MKEADYYKKLENDEVKCFLCPRHCIIKNGFRGYCRARYNKEGTLFTENEYISALALDPIEKKPLFKFFPGSKILSVGGSGCNFRCIFCQNWQISQCENQNHIKIKPKELAEKALELVVEGNIGLAYTYSDPIIMFEYVMEAAKEARKKDLKNVFVSNGYIEEEPLMELLDYIDAFNIDVKAFSLSEYQKNFTADFEIIKKNLEIILKKEKHLEITCLIVPGINDKIEEAEEFFLWLSEVNREVPVHISRYFPCYKGKMPATDIKVMMEIKNIASNYMDFVFTGNI